MKLIIVQPRTLADRGSFIDYHISLLKPEIEYYNGYYPITNSVEGNFLKFPLKNNIFRGTLKRIAPKQFHTFYNKELTENLVRHGIDCALLEYGLTGASLSDAFVNSKIPFVVHFHGFDAFHFDTIKAYLNSYQKMFKSANGLIAVSNDMKEQLVHLGAPAEKVFCNPYGVNTELFDGAEPANAQPDFIAVGRFTPKKSPINTIKAFHIVHEKVKESRLFMIGSGELLNDCKRLVGELNIDSSVFFLGSLNHGEILQYLKKGRVFVQHSMRAQSGDSEGMPNTILEALSSGLPVISTTHAGIKEAVVHGKTGYLVDEGDYKSMAEYMLLLIKDAEKAGEMGRAARNYILENYEMKDRIERLREIIIKVCK